MEGKKHQTKPLTTPVFSCQVLKLHLERTQTSMHVLSLYERCAFMGFFGERGYCS